MSSVMKELRQNEYVTAEKFHIKQRSSWSIHDVSLRIITWASSTRIRIFKLKGMEFQVVHS